MKTIRIGTRGSKLALWQAHWVEEGLCKRWKDLTVEIITIQTSGEKLPEAPFASIGSRGFFTSEIEEALLDGSIDVAVHCLKDLPTELPQGLEIGAYCEREYARDVLITKSGQMLEELPPGSRIGTSSLRRVAQILSLRPDLQCIDIRGNVDTRLRKLEEQETYDGIVLAAAGVIRLGQQDAITQYLAEKIFLPAPGQGVIALEIRTECEEVRELVAALNHQPTEYEARAERQFLRALEGGCRLPIGARAMFTKSVLDDGTLDLLGMVASLDGREIVRVSESRALPRIAADESVPAILHVVPELLGNLAAATALCEGARQILKSVTPASESESTAQ